jgi:hypothetical protein
MRRIAVRFGPTERAKALSSTRFDCSLQTT